MKQHMISITSILCALSLTLVFSLSTFNLVSAEDVELTLLNTTSSLLADENPEGLIDSLDICNANLNEEAFNNIKILKADDVIKNVYWADLEPWSGTAKDLLDNEVTYYGVIPKYLLKPNETALKDKTYSDYSSSFACSGISNNAISLTKMDLTFWKEYGYYNGPDDTQSTDCEAGKACPVPENDCKKAVKEIYNPFQFKENELLTVEEIKNSALLYTTADLQKHDSKDSSAIDEYAAESEMKLDFIINADWFKRLLNGYALHHTRGGNRQQDDINKQHNDAKGQCDSQMVYTLDIPTCLTIKEQQAVISDNQTISDMFDITTEVKTEKKDNKLVKQILIVSLRLKSSYQSEKSWKDIIAKTRNLDLSSVKLMISGLKINKECDSDKNISIKGTWSAYFDWLYTYGNDVSDHHYLLSVAKQNPQGMDSGKDKAKTNLISYTFKVKGSSDPIIDSVPSMPEIPYVPAAGEPELKMRVAKTGEIAQGVSSIAWIILLCLGVGLSSKRKQ